jgi:hypothetical protein
MSFEKFSWSIFQEPCTMPPLRQYLGMKRKMRLSFVLHSTFRNFAPSNHEHEENHYMHTGQHGFYTRVAGTGHE